MDLGIRAKEILRVAQGIATKSLLRPVIIVAVLDMVCVVVQASLQGPKLLGSAPTTVVLERAVRAKRTRTAASGTVISP